MCMDFIGSVVVISSVLADKNRLLLLLLVVADAGDGDGDGDGDGAYNFLLWCDSGMPLCCLLDDQRVFFHGVLWRVLVCCCQGSVVVRSR